MKGKVEKILARHFPEQAWRINQPRSGLQKEAYIAQNERYRLFLKLDTEIPALPILANLGVAPPPVATGTYYGRPYIIQKFGERRAP